MKGVPPVTLAEWTLDGDGNRDFYDGESSASSIASIPIVNYLHAVSLVDGYDLPMRIINNVNCPVAECTVDLGPICE